MARKYHSVGICDGLQVPREVHTMRVMVLVASVLMVTVVLLSGCSGTVIYDIDGQWGVGTLRFVYDDDTVWVLRQAIIEVVEDEDLIYISGYDRDDELWAYRGEYTRTENRVTVQDMLEIDLGDRDTMDMTLQFSQYHVSGTVTNWIRDDDGDVVKVGVVPVSGTRLDSYVPRPLSTAAAAASNKQPKLQ